MSVGVSAGVLGVCELGARDQGDADVGGRARSESVCLSGKVSRLDNQYGERKNGMCVRGLVYYGWHWLGVSVAW